LVLTLNLNLVILGGKSFFGDLLSALKIKSSIVARMRTKADPKKSSALSALYLKPKNN
jgi:hypothetical protein